MNLFPGHSVETRTNELAGANNDVQGEPATRHEDEALSHSGSLDALRQLTGHTAHEFNNLLMAILGNLDLIAHRAQDSSAEGRARTAGYIANARRAAWDCAGLSKQLLALAHRESGRMEIAGINSAIRDCSDFLEHAAGETIDIEMNFSGDAWSAEIDLAQFEAALLNVAANARAAMPKGGKLRIATQNKRVENRTMLGRFDSLVGEGPLPADYVLISLSDQGDGIDPAILPYVFEPCLAAKHAGKGSDLGLSHVYSFVRQSRGYLGIASNPGAGTTVTLCLPRAD
jgi:signal transduction histidine kinase